MYLKILFFFSQLRIYISQYWDYHNDLWCFKKNQFFRSFYSSKNPRKISFHNIENDMIVFSCTKSALDLWLCDTKD